MKWSEIIQEDSYLYGMQLAEFAKRERESGKKLWPPQSQVFRALELTPPSNVKIVIMGQDPYHTPNQANGLAFSVSPGNPLQPSLVNIFKELRADLGITPPKSGDLTPWAERGVLLLNTTLTVYEHSANSCSNWHWDKFTKGVLRAATHLPQPIVFILWGSSAYNLLDSLIQKGVVYEYDGAIARENLLKKAYIMSSHPSPLSARKRSGGYPAFVGSKPFSTANRLLQEMGGQSIDWSL